MIRIEGQLEIDPVRGVIWFHANDTGWTVLRISQLPLPMPDMCRQMCREMVDVSCTDGAVSYSG
jgi:hypothetical protein